MPVTGPRGILSACSGLGSVSWTIAGLSGSDLSWQRCRQWVESSTIKVAKLCTANPLSVWRWDFFWRAPAEGSTGATGSRWTRASVGGQRLSLSYLRQGQTSMITEG